MFFAVGLNLVYVEGVVIYVARGLVDGSLGECDPNYFLKRLEKKKNLLGY